jgi:RNA polymerase sigma-70 factor (ECF subfamily)
MDWFEQGIWKARTMLKSYALKLLCNVDDADDAVQHVMLKAVENRASFERGTNLDAWLMTILKNHVFGKARRGKRVVYTDNLGYADSIVAPDNPERAMIVAEGLDEVFRLKDKQADAVVLAGLGLSYSEMSDQLNAPEGTLKSRINRARVQLAKTGALNG